MPAAVVMPEPLGLEASLPSQVAECLCIEVEPVEALSPLALIGHMQLCHGGTAARVS